MLLGDIGLKQSIPTLIHEDNQSANELTRNPKFHYPTKHIDLSFHFVREQVACNAIEVRFCPTEEMAADILTKGLPKVRYEDLRNLIGIKCI